MFTRRRIREVVPEVLPAESSELVEETITKPHRAAQSHRVPSNPRGLKPPRKPRPAAVEPQLDTAAVVGAADPVPIPLAVPAREPTAPLQVTPQPERLELVCEIRFWRGYRKGMFYAGVVIAGEDVALAESPPFRVARKGDAPERTEDAVAAYEALRRELAEAGWEHVGEGATWYDDTLRLIPRAAEGSGQE